MKIYKTNVHFSGTVPLDIEADSEKEAKRQATKIGSFDPCDCDYPHINFVEIIDVCDENGKHIITNKDREKEGQLVL